MTHLSATNRWERIFHCWNTHNGECDAAQIMDAVNTVSNNSPLLKKKQAKIYSNE